jgi:hypothetical protein
MSTLITVWYSSIDGCREVRKFKTFAGACRYASRMVGEYPTVGRGYAVSDDGIGKVEVRGCTLREMFPGGC